MKPLRKAMPGRIGFLFLTIRAEDDSILLEDENGLLARIVAAPKNRRRVKVGIMADERIRISRKEPGKAKA